MTREDTKYCEECKHCKSIGEVYVFYCCTTDCDKEFYVDCDIDGNCRFQRPVVYCKYKKLKKEKKKKNVKRKR